MNVNDAVARILKTEGVEWVSCFPSNNLIESVASEGIRTVLFRQERGALMAADGYSRMNDRRKFGVAITQGGPGSENSHGGIAQAFSDNIPILYLAGGPALGQYAVRPNFSPVRSYQSVSKHAEVITAPGQVAAVMRRAFHNLRNGRPGPVIVEIPADVGGQEVPDSALNYQPPKRLPQAPARGDVADAARLLLNARKPGDLVRDGRPVFLGHRGIAGAGRAYPDSRLYHHAGQVVLRRAASAVAGRGQRRNLAAGPPVDPGVGRAVRCGVQHDPHQLRTAHSRRQGHHPQRGEHRGHQQGLLS